MRDLLILLSILALSSAFSPLETYVGYKGTYTHELNANSEGIRRSLHSDAGKGDGYIWQFFYFCDVPKNKKKCGAWVDAKGNKIKDANNNVKKTKEGAVFSKMTDKDAGIYTREPENSDESAAYLERFQVYVLSPPPPPPPKK